MDSLSKDIFDELKEEFQKLKHPQLDKNEVQEKSNQDSVSKLDEILSKLKKDSPDYIKILAMVVSILYEKAKMALHEKTLEKSKEFLEKGLDLIKEDIDNPQITFVYLRIINYLSYVVSRMGDLERARTLLEAVVSKELLSEPIVYSTEDLFNVKKSDPRTNKVKIQKLMINNMQMLGWIYGRQGLGDQYADMIHRSLQKELDLNDGDPIQWATRCSKLAFLFLSQDKWDNARYHLTAAQGVLDPLEIGLMPSPALFKAQAELARIWVNYGLQIFSVSKKSFLENIWNESKETPKPDEALVEEEKFRFSGLEVNLPRVPIKQIEKIEDARELFSHTHRWLKRARLYYTLRDYPMQYVNIILELSELYRYLAFYEKDLDSQYEVHKKRYETLETLSDILREVRPSCYTSVSVEIIREIMEVQIELMNLNLKKLYNPGGETPANGTDLQKRIAAVAHINAKIESLCNVDDSSSKATVEDNIDIDKGLGEDTDERNDRDNLRGAVNHSSGEGEATVQEKPV
ncbi:KIF-binding protein isoform X1 [Leptinotarsa decemlineata]|uniref:KIF-binding protein isoform X1 n=1 Tax=Leptinotarsa decemlineata TaxID=7539 RepID=UPI003D3054EB